MIPGLKHIPNGRIKRKGQVSLLKFNRNIYSIIDQFKVKNNLLCHVFSGYKMSRLMGKPTICIGENKGADQLRGNREADQRLCFRYSDSTVPLLLKSEISSF